MYVVCWCLNGKYSCGKPQPDLGVAYSWVQQGNKDYGPGTHWVFKLEDKEHA